MTRQEVLREIEKMLGMIPGMFKVVPEDSLELEWRLFKKMQIDEGPIPAKYRELIGVSIAAAARCRYCTYFHTQMAKVAGATDDEIGNAIQLSKTYTGWSTYINGHQLDFEIFRGEVDRICEHVSQMMRGKK